MLDGAEGEATAQAMRILCAMAANQGAARLIDVTQGHIDGCIYASPANLTFAEKMADMGAKVRIPTTMNAISVDHGNWRAQGVPDLFGGPAQRLADAYVRMGCQPTFTCSPYLLDTAPEQGEVIAWSESNAVIYANSVLGARTAKHPDFLDLCIAMTGRAPLSGVYLDEPRQARRIIDVDLPDGFDDAFWPLIGWLSGKAAPDRIPLLRGLQAARPSPENLKAVCAAFGTTSAAPMLHVEGVTPEADRIAPDADHARITRADMAAGWRVLNDGPEAVELVAIGSPHASLIECAALADALAGRRVAVATIVTAGRAVIGQARADGTLARLEAAGVQVLPDLCWCSISEPVFPPGTKALMTNSGKYAHYGPGLSGRAVRFGGLAACAEAAVTGHAPKTLPDWLE
jgi:predicted aconitase